MTEKDLLIQELRKRVARLEAELDDIVKKTRGCRFCENLDADCSPSDSSCLPKWRGLRDE